MTDGVRVGFALAPAAALPEAAGAGFAAAAAACAGEGAGAWWAVDASRRGAGPDPLPWLAGFASPSRACALAVLAGGDAAKATLVEMAASVVAVAAATPRVSLAGPRRRPWPGLALVLLLAKPLMLTLRPRPRLRRCRPEL